MIDMPKDLIPPTDVEGAIQDAKTYGRPSILRNFARHQSMIILAAQEYRDLWSAENPKDSCPSSPELRCLFDWLDQSVQTKPPPEPAKPKPKPKRHLQFSNLKLQAVPIPEPKPKKPTTRRGLAGIGKPLGAGS